MTERMQLHTRKSNFELLRIIAIVMVLILHADFYALQAPSNNEIVTHPLDSGLKIGMQFLSISAVNIFVMISGWFGINHSLRGIGNLLFQTFFLHCFLGGCYLWVKYHANFS